MNRSVNPRNNGAVLPPNSLQNSCRFVPLADELSRRGNESAPPDWSDPRCKLRITGTAQNRQLSTFFRAC